MTEFPIPTANSNPFQIALGPDGALWFTEVSGNKIGRIATDGSITEFATPTAGNPGGIAAGSDGALWFTEIGGNNIGRITTGGAISEFAVPTASSFSHTIAAGPDGALWFAEAGGNKIGRITVGGAFTEFALPNSGSQPFDITTGPDAALWFTEIGANKIGRITTGGTIVEFAVPTTSSQPAFIAAGPDGALWFTEAAGDKIGRITTSGSFSEFALPSGSQPQGIATGPDGAMWFTEAGSDEIGRITTSGVITQNAIPTANADPFGIALGGNAHLWFTEFTGNKIGEVATQVAWASAISGDFASAGNWTPAGVPGPNNDVALSPAGSFTVTSNANETVDSVATAAGATLMVTGGTFTIENGTGSGSGVNAGALVAAGGLLQLTGKIAGSGSVTIQGGSLALDGGYAGVVNFSGLFGVFVGGAGNHNLVGNGADNTIDYSAATSGVQFNLFTGLAYNNFGGTTVGVDHFSNISFFVAGIGTDNNVFIGGPGNHAFNGNGRFGNSLDYSNSNGPVLINVATGQAQNGFGGTDQFANVQFFIGASGNSTFFATSVAGATTGDSFNGGIGGTNTLDYSLATANITFNFTAGNANLTVGTATTNAATDTFSNIQVFNGGQGNDTFIGGPGNHVINGAGGVNTLDYSSATTGVQFNIAGGIAYNNFGGPTVTVDRFSNIHIFLGGAGNDVFEGGPGNNVLDGEGGTNTLDYSAAPGAVSIDLATGTAVNGYGGTDHFARMQFLHGSAAHDDFNAANVSGAYVLFGGGNSDTFSFSGAFGNGFVADFTASADLIYLARNEFADFAAVQSHAAQIGGGTVITMDSRNSITLQGVALASLNASEFRFL